MGLGVVACQSVSRVIIVTPEIAGSSYVGSEECTLCHEGIGYLHNTSVHARLEVDGETGLDLGCEACHGPGELHSMEGEGRHLIHNPRRDPATCLRCHVDVQGQFALMHSHPLGDDKTTCIDCHAPHGEDPKEALEGFAQLGASGSCASCHAAQSGPYVFEHEAQREGCETCHQVHGSANPKLLKVANSSLCLQCHFVEQRPNALMIGGVDHTGFGYVQQGNCWTAGCHEAVHGSHVNGSLRF